MPPRGGLGPPPQAARPAGSSPRAMPSRGVWARRHRRPGQQGRPPEGAMTAPRARLDAELVRRGLARSREQAGELVAAGLVAVAGQRASKPATQVARDAPITVTETDEPGYVSRGGYKLAGALEVFGASAIWSWRAGTPWTPGRPPAASPTCCCGPAPRTWWRPTWATASWPGRCAPTPGSRSWTGSTYGPWGRSLRCPTWWWPTSRSSRSPWCCRPWRPPRRPGRTSSCWSSPSSRWARAGSVRAAWCGTPRTVRPP